MASANKTGFYLNGRFLGRDYNEAFYNLDDREIRPIVYDYIMDVYDLEDLAHLASINELPEDVGFLKEAFDKVEEYAIIRMREPYVPVITYGGLEWRDGDVPKTSKPKKSANARPKAGKPAKRPGPKRSSGRRARCSGGRPDSPGTPSPRRSSTGCISASRASRCTSISPRSPT